MSNINLNIVGTGNFTQVEAAIKHLQTSIAQLNAAGVAGPAFQRSLVQSIAQVNALAQAQGLMRVHTTSLSSEADKLTKRIAKGKTTFQDFRNAIGGATKANSTFMEIAKRQIAIQQMSAIQVGKTVFGYENLGRAQLTAAAAAKAHATAIAAQNAVLRQSLVHIVNWGKNMQWTGRQLTMGLTAPLVLFGAQAAKIFNEVDKNLTNLAKVYGVGLEQPTTAALQAIRKEMLALSTELGKTLGISAAEVTDIGAQFAAAGLQGEQLVFATKQAARMVVLGEADKQEAIKATISLQTAYKLNTTELTEAVNFFNAAQAATSTNMADLIGAVPRVGPVIKQLGGTYKDMVAIITALKEGGVPAGEAANAIKNSLARIIQPTEKAKGVLLDFGIDIENIVNKNAGNLTATITELQAGLLKLDGLTRQRAISELFGKYQFSRMSAFIENFGQIGTQSQKVMEMMGLSAAELANIADEQTKKIQQSASGRFRIAVETLKNTMIPIGEATLDMFTKVLEKVTAFFDAVQSLPGPIKTALKWLLLIGGVVGPLTMLAGLFGNLMGTIGMGVVRLKVFGGAMKMLFATRDMNAAKIILSGFRELDPAVTAATKAINVFKNEELSAEQVSERFALMLNEMTGGLINLQNRAGMAGATLVSSFEAAAGAAATAAAATGSIIPPGLISGATSNKNAFLSNLSKHHAIPASYIPMIQGGEKGHGTVKGSGRYTYAPVWMTPLDPYAQKAVGTLPTVYSSKEGPIYQNLMKRFDAVSEYTTAQREKVKSTVPVSSAAFGASLGAEQSLYRALGSIDSKIAAEYTKKMRDLAKQYSGQGEKLQFELQKLLGQMFADPRLEAQSNQLKAAFISNTNRIKNQFMQLMAMAEAEITTSVSAATAAAGRDLDPAELTGIIKEKMSKVFKIAGTDIETSVIRFIESEGIEITEELRTALVSSGVISKGAREGTSAAPIIKALSQISTLVNGEVLQIAGSLEEMVSMLLANDTQVIESAPALIQSVETVEQAARRKVNEITTQINDVAARVAAEPIAPTQVSRFSGRRSREAFAEVRAIDTNISRMMSGAEAARLESLNALKIAETRQATVKNEVTNLEQLLSTARADMEANKAQASARVVELENLLSAKLSERAAADAAVANSTKQLDAAHKKLAAVEEALARRQAAMGNIKGSPFAGMGAMGATSAIGMAAMLPSMFGVHNEFSNTLMQFGMMIMMVGMFGSMLGAAMLPLIAITAAVFAVVKGFQMLNKEMENNAKATEAFIGLTQTETENLGITVRKIGDIPTKDLGENADQARSSIEKLVESFKNLAEDDSLKQFIESLKEAAEDEGNKNWNVRRLEEKYMQYRAAGATDEAARNQVLAIAQAAGIPLAGTEAMRRVATTSNYTQGQFMVAAQRGGFQALSGDVKTEFATGVNTGETEAAARANAQNIYNTLLFATGNKSVRILSEIDKQMNKSAGSANYYRLSVKELFNQMGEGALKSQAKMMEFGYSTKDQLLGAQLVLNGFVNSWEDLDKLVGTKEFTVKVNQMIQQQEISTAETAFVSGAEKYIKQTNDARTSSANKAADAQQKIVDRLKEELDTRKKILDAQEKQNQFQMSMSEMQQAFTEALAVGDMAKAASLQEKMGLSQARYNQELKTTAMENRIANEEKKLKSISDQAAATSKLAEKTKTATQRLTELQERIEIAILKNGEPTKATINSWVKELTDMGMPTEKATKLIKDFVKSFSSQVDTRLSSDIISQLTKVASKEQELTFLAAYRVETQAGKSEMEAAEIAYEKAYGQQATLTSDGKTLLVSAGPGRTRRVYTMGQGLFPGANASGYSGPDTSAKNKTPWVVPGEGGSLPKFADKASAQLNYNNQTQYASFKDSRGNNWQLVPTATGGYQWQIVGGTLTAPAYGMGGMVKSYGMGGKVMSYGMGGKIMNYFGGSWGGIKGPGSWTSDSIPAMVSNGEYVVNAAAVSKVGTSFMDTLNSLGYANTAPLMSIMSATGSPVIPVEIVPSNNSSSMYNDHSNINIYVAGTNATPQEIANAVSNAQQRRMGTVASRGVIYS